MTDITTPQDPEVETLRARVAELEALLAEQSRATNALVARSQEKLYWLERWHPRRRRPTSAPAKGATWNR